MRLCPYCEGTGNRRIATGLRPPEFIMCDQCYGRGRYMKILVTGSEGFVGKVLIRKLHVQGHEVTGWDVEEVDITDVRSVDKKMKEVSPEVIIHLAAMSRDKECSGRATECFNVNVLGTLNLLDWSQFYGVKQFIFASSEWVYGDSEVEKDEGAFINTMTLGEYALSKHVSEVNLLQNFMRTSLPTTILRFGIIYGPRENNWSVVESLFNTIRMENKVTVGSLQTGRHYIHVEDIVSGIVKSIGLTSYHIINLEGDKFISLEEIIHTSELILGKEKIKVIQNVMSGPSIRKIKNMKAKLILGWKPEYSLIEGLKSLL